MGPIDVDFVIKGTSKSDINLFLGPVNEDQKIVEFEIHDKLMIAHLMAQANIFSSISEARRNGWDKPIPTGFHHFIVGKKRKSLTILNINE